MWDVNRPAIFLQLPDDNQHVFPHFSLKEKKDGDFIRQKR
jgi:hypothetical protein